MSDKTYLSCADTAKLLRKALKTAFPGVKFSVRSDTYAGGASIDVSWTDGPRASDVDKVAGAFAGADFDGMIDLKTYNTHWLAPDGSVNLAHAPGTQDSRGYLPAAFGDAPGPTATLVSLGADFVFTHRKVSDAWRDDVLALFAATIGRDLDANDRGVVWHQDVPLAVRRYGSGDDNAGDLLRMADQYTTDLSSVFHQYTGARSR